MITDTLDKTQTRYKGEATTATARAKLAFFPMGQVTLELIEPIGEPSTWHDQLKNHGPSLHHIAVEIQGMQQRIATLSKHGLELVQTGEYTGGRYTYFDGTEKSWGGD
ncbi:MAG: VOC family protein [Trueperaceae bacterium]